MIKALRITLFAVSLSVAAGLSHGEGEQNSLNESTDASACESRDAAACDRFGQAAYERAAELRRSGETTSQVQQEFKHAIKMAERAWEAGCGLDFVSSCTKLGNLSYVMEKPMLSVRAFNHGCRLGDDAACEIIQNFKDEKQNETLACLVETERLLGAVPWTIRGSGVGTSMRAPGFSLTQVFADEAKETRLELEFKHVVIIGEDFSGFVFKPDWVNALVQDGDLKLSSVNKFPTQSWGLRITGNESATPALLAQFASGQGISFSNEVSEDYKIRYPNRLSGEILYPSFPQALEVVRAIRQQVQSEAEQGLCNPDL